jgi:hypothetical protein
MFMKWLKQKSTIGGLLGLIVSGSAATGADWANDPETVEMVATAAPVAALSLLSMLSLWINEG